jgi:hypothetical protein
MFAIAVLCSGCATPSDTIAPAFVPSEREGLIYGRMEFVVDGKTLATDAHVGLVKSNITTSVSKFSGIDKLNTSGWIPGEFQFGASASERGEFSAKLPVGRYYIVAFDYWGASPAVDKQLYWSTYAEKMGTSLYKPTIITFDVLPNKATYLGTIRHLIQRDGPQQLYFDIQLADEYANSTKVFLERFPALSNAIETRAYKIETLTAPIKK